MMSFARANTLMSKLMLGSATVALMFPLAASAATKTNGVAPKIFEGNYRIISKSFGLCSPEMLIATYPDDDGNIGMEAGDFSFVRINAGPFVDDAEGMRLSENTYTTADQRLISHSRNADKDPAGATMTQSVEMHLVGTTLTVKSIVHNSAPGGGIPIDDVQTCSYKRIRCEDAAAGCM